MQFDDVFRGHFAKATADLGAWAKSVEPFAHSEIVATQAYWKLKVTPVTPGACPFELILRADKHYDVLIAGEVYEDRPLEDFGLFGEMAAAIAAANVERLLISSTLTGAPQAIATRISLANGANWSGTRALVRGKAAAPAEDCVIGIHSFLPYRR